MEYPRVRKVTSSSREITDVKELWTFSLSD